MRFGIGIGLINRQKLGGGSGLENPSDIFQDGDLGGIWGKIPYFLDTAGNPEATWGDPVAGIPDALSEEVDWQQPTSTARPILGRVPRTGRRNLLSWTEDFGNPSWGKVNIDSPVYSLEYNDWEITKSTEEVNFAGIIQSGIYPAGREAVACVEIRKAPAEWDGIDVAIQIRQGFAGGEPVLNGNMDPVTGNPVNQNCVVEDSGTHWLVKMNPATPVGWVGFSVRINSYNTGTVIGVRFPQAENSESPTPYQRVTNEYDITEEGVESIPLLHFDGTDDFIPHIDTYPAGTYTVAIAGVNGTWIDTFEWEGGTFQVGVGTYAGGPAGIIPILGDLLVEGCFFINREITQSERNLLIQYYGKRGSPGVITLGPEFHRSGYSKTESFESTILYDGDTGLGGRV